MENALTFCNYTPAYHKMIYVLCNNIESIESNQKHDSRGQFNWVNQISLPFRFECDTKCDLGQVKPSQFKTRHNQTL